MKNLNPKNANLNPHRPADGSFDMYSVGKIMHAMKQAFGQLSPEVLSLARQLLSQQPSERPSATDVLETKLPELFAKFRVTMGWGK
jgi:hypothetical protein